MQLLPAIGIALWVFVGVAVDIARASLVFPSTGLYGLFLAIAVPVDIPDKNVFISYNFEGNFVLPANSSQFADLNPLAYNTILTTGRKARSLDRITAYNLLEERLTNEGFPGKKCLLRSICEASETPLSHNGLLGGILHVIFTPSSSVDEGLQQSYYMAEKNGLARNCQKYVSECPKGLMDIISKVAIANKFKM